MSTTVETLEAEALRLTAAERARLIDRLIASLDADPEIEEAWASEVERRHTEIEGGAVSLLPGPEALAKLKAEFRCSENSSVRWPSCCDIPPWARSGGMASVVTS